MQKQTNTLVANFAVRGMLSCLSHQETLALFQRAFVRSHIPMTYSQGFNPHPYVSIPLPRSVGVASDVEKISVLVESPIQSDLKDEWLSAVRNQVPENCDILSMELYPGKKKFIPVQAGYAFPLNVTKDILARLNRCRDELDKGCPIEVQRVPAKKGRQKKILDISGFLESIDIQQDRVTVVCRITQAGTVRINEIMDWMGIGQNQLTGPVKRTLVRWNSDKG